MVRRTAECMLCGHRETKNGIYELGRFMLNHMAVRHPDEYSKIAKHNKGLNDKILSLKKQIIRPYLETNFRFDERKVEEQKKIEAIV